MARGFGGETTEQEARGNEGLSSTDIAGGREDAATSAMASGRDVDVGGGSDGSGGFLSNDYKPDFDRVSQIQDIMQAQKSFNRSRGITDTNPFGNDNIYTRYLGIDPKNIDYSENISRSNRISIANNQFSKFMNPQNKPGMVGYNPDFPTADEGQLRAGVQSAGYKTQFGDVMGQARQQSTGEMAARGLAGLFGGLPGFALGQIGTQEYGLPGQPGFDRFDPENPNPGGGILGQFLGGLNPTQAKDALVGAFAPSVPAPTPTSIGTTTSALNSWSAGRDAAKKQALADAVSSVMSQAQTSPSIANMSLEDKKTAIRELAERNFQPYLDAMPDAGATIPGKRISTVSTTGGIDAATAKKADEIFGASSLNYDFFTDPQAGGTYPSAMAGEQLSGLFGEDPRTAGFRSLQDNIQSIINNEPLPDNQNMYGPGMPDQTPLTPDELNDILAPSGMELGRGPSTANQYAQVDYSNLNNVGGNIYQAGQQKSAFDSFLETFGMKEAGRRPSGQIYSPAGNKKPFFDYFGFGQ